MPDEKGRSSDQAYVESHESEYITPIDAVKDRAMADVFKVAPGLEAAGNTTDHIQFAAKFMADKAAKEFEENQGQDPLRIALEGAKASASTENDRMLVEQYEKTAEGFRSAVIEADRSMGAQEMLRQGNISEHSIHELLTLVRGRSNPNIVQYANGDYLSTVELVGPYYDPRKGNLSPSQELVEGTLKQIGVLKEGITINDLQTLPKDAPIGEPQYYRGSDSVLNLKTRWEGIRASYSFMSRIVSLHLDEPNVANLMKLPPSK